MHQSDSSGNGPGPIPPRWLKCPRKSAALIGGKFLALKTPLGLKFDDQVPLQNQFTPAMLFQAMSGHKVKIGLWIDLTNTSRFYDRKDVEKHGARYFKIQCRGHGECPNEKQVSLFVNMCDTFISRNPLECIAVHCTHGFNRTGYMISSYFIAKEGWGCDRALVEFSIARPPGIYKADYIIELYKEYGDGLLAPEPPKVPDWGQDGDEDDEERQNGNADESSRREGSGRRVKISSFMEGVPGVTQVTEEPLLSSIQKKIKDVCGWKKNGFPGCQPVSMTRENLNMLTHSPYKVSWKADGTRYMMYISDTRSGDKPKVYFADRDHCIFVVQQIDFREKHQLTLPLCDTLLDGEMVIDIDPISKQKFPRYLVYDAIRIHGRDIQGQSFHLRHGRIHTDIIDPRRAAMKRGLITADQSFSIRRKDFFVADREMVAKFLSPQFREELAHEPDGLIFQPDEEPYVCGRCDSVLKWKPLSMNSVDFKMKVVVTSGEGILPIKIGELYVGGYEHPFDTIKLNKELREHNGKIIECKYENRKWVFMRVRTDKSFPNGLNTAKGVCQSIVNPVTEEFLLDFIKENGHRYPDKELMPPPAKRPRR